MNIPAVFLKQSSMLLLMAAVDVQQFSVQNSSSFVLLPL